MENVPKRIPVKGVVVMFVLLAGFGVTIFSITANESVPYQINPEKVLLYVADLSSWSGSDYGYIYVPQVIAHDSFTDQSHPEENYGSWSLVNVETTTYGPCGQAFIDVGNASLPYLILNETRSLQEYVLIGGSRLHAYASTYFKEDTLNWTNQPPAGVSIWESNNVVAGTYINISLGKEQYLNIQKDTVGDVQLGTRENPTFAPVLWHNISKFYSTPNILSIQTGNTEILSLSSPAFVPIYLQPGDVIELVFSTTSAHQISLNLLSSQNIQQQIEISCENNTNFDPRLMNLTITSPILINQISVVGLCDDAQCIQITHLSISR